MKELIDIQSELKAPKNQYNSFGKYKFRSCEDILEAVKPLCKKHEVELTITDDIIVIPAQEKSAIKNDKKDIIGYDESGARVYVKATVTIKNSTGESLNVSAFARESFNKSGMDSSQITGAASSYARKYALNGLFLIDDNKDSDKTNDKKPAQKKVIKKLTNEQFNGCVKSLKDGKSMDWIKDFAKQRGIEIDKETETKIKNAAEL